MPGPQHRSLAPGPGRGRKASERPRRSILDAARACFGRDGYAGATAARIGEEAGVSNGLLYPFFRNKDDLLQVELKSRWCGTGCARWFPATTSASSRRSRSSR